MPSVVTLSFPTTRAGQRPFTEPRFWHGMPLHVFWRLLRVGGLRNIEPRCWPLVFSALAAGLANSALAAVQRRRYGAAIAATEIKHPPIIIIGHMRTGTSLLHNLMVLDRRFDAPNLRECFTPSHCLVSSRMVKGGLSRLLPSTRPQDNMELDFRQPGEEEFALMNIGLPSPYRQAAFPNIPGIDAEYLDFNGVSDDDRRRWQEGLLWFVKVLTLRNRGRRIVLKSPFHLGRVRVLLELFPAARFIHIARDPYKVFPSTVNMIKLFYMLQGLQTPKHLALEQDVFSWFERLYSRFEQDRSLIPPGHLHEVRYEDLVADPEAELRRLYRGLDLGDFDPVVPRLQAFLDQRKGYRTNTFQIDERMQAELDRRFADLGGVARAPIASRGLSSGMPTKV
jgi:omega-hydroxy-beta-dihydromenaquinone-9 sulfotransferase